MGFRSPTGPPGGARARTTVRSLICFCWLLANTSLYLPPRLGPDVEERDALCCQAQAPRQLHVWVITPEQQRWNNKHNGWVIA